MEENVNQEPMKVKNHFSRLLSFQGRAKRKEYWLVTLGITLLMFPVMIVQVIAEENPEFALLGVCLYVVCWIPVAYVSVALSVRRLHDLGRNGWLVLLNFLPILNVVLCIYLGFFKGQEQDNPYGPNPYNA